MLKQIKISDWEDRTIKDWHIDGRHLYIVFTDGTFGSLVATSGYDGDVDIDNDEPFFLNEYTNIDFVNKGIIMKEEWDKVRAEAKEKDKMREAQRTIQELEEYKRLKAKYGNS